MKDYKIIIPEPCKQHWTKMSPNDSGRHCSLCEKTVVDFTTMTDEQVQTYFKQKKGLKICGYYKSSQVEAPRPFLHNKLVKWHEYFERNGTTSLLRAGALAGIVFCMMLVGCRKNTVGERMTNQENYFPQERTPEKGPPEEGNTEHYLLGDTIYVEKDTNIIIKADPSGAPIEKQKK